MITWKQITYILSWTSTFHKLFANNQYIVEVPLEGGSPSEGHPGAAHLLHHIAEVRWPCCLPGSPGNRALGLQLPALTPSSRWRRGGCRHWTQARSHSATQAIHVHRCDTRGLRQLPRVPRQRRAPVQHQAILAHRWSGKRKGSRIGILCYTCMVLLVRPAKCEGEPQTNTFRACDARQQWKWCFEMSIATYSSNQLSRFLF